MVSNKYSQGIMNDGPCILKNGEPLTPEEIVSELNRLSEIEAPVDKLINTYPVCLYFGNDGERDEFISLVKEAVPGLTAVKKL